MVSLTLLSWHARSGSWYEENQAADAGRPAFEIRVLLAATLAASYGIYTQISILPAPDGLFYTSEGRSAHGNLLHRTIVHVLRPSLTQLDSLFFAPGEEAANDAGVGAAGVGVGDAGGEELIGGEQGILPGAPQDGGGAIEGLGGRQKGGLGRGLNHGDIGDDKILYRTL